MNDRILIRPVTEVHLPAIYDMACGLAEKKFPVQEFSQIFLHTISNPDNCYFAAFLSEKIIGYISIHTQLLLHHCGRVAEIQELYIKEEYRRTGAGKLLLEAIEKVCAEKKCVAVEVTSNKARTWAQAFYLKNNYQESHYKFTKKLQ